MSDLNYYIWSFEHNSWWRWHSRGYTTDIKQAGKYSFDNAKQICDSANAYQPINEPNEEMRHVDNYFRTKAAGIVKRL